MERENEIERSNQVNMKSTYLKKKLFILTLIILITPKYLLSQIVLNDLLYTINNNDFEKIDGFLEKKGFTITNIKNETGYKKIDWGKENIKENIENFHKISKLHFGDTTTVIFLTTNPKLFQQIKTETTINKWIKLKESFEDESLSVLYKKGTIISEFRKYGKTKEMYDTPYFVVILTKPTVNNYK